jgi:hypothetical protein
MTHEFDPSYAQAAGDERCVCGQPRISAVHTAPEAMERRAAVLRDVRERRIPLSRALHDMRADTLFVADLLAAAPDWSRYRARDVLGRLRISELKRCGNLTPGQRAALSRIAAGRQQQAAA